MLLVMMTICSHVLFAQMPPAESGTELLSDPVFAQGFNLTAATNSAPKLELGTLQVTAESAQKPPAWRIAQWALYLFAGTGSLYKNGGRYLEGGDTGKTSCHFSFLGGRYPVIAGSVWDSRIWWASPSEWGAVAAFAY